MKKSPLLAMLALRTILLLAGQSLTGLILSMRGVPSPFLAAGAWWTVFGSLADVGCLVMIAVFLKKRGIGIAQFLGRFRGGGEVLVGLGVYLAVFPTYLASYFVSSRIAYGTWNPDLPVGILHLRSLPTWAMAYTVGLWWLIWSPTEELTYQLVLLPEASARLGAKWGVGLVWFWWTLQHAFLPLIPDWRYVLWRFGAFAAGVFVTIMIYRKLQRIYPMIAAHYSMDLIVAITTLSYSRPP